MVLFAYVDDANPCRCKFIQQIIRFSGWNMWLNQHVGTHCKKLSVKLADHTTDSFSLMLNSHGISYQLRWLFTLCAMELQVLLSHYLVLW